VDAEVNGGGQGQKQNAESRGGNQGLSTQDMRSKEKIFAPTVMGNPPENFCNLSFRLFHYLKMISSFSLMSWVSI